MELYLSKGDKPSLLLWKKAGYTKNWLCSMSFLVLFSPMPRPILDFSTASIAKLSSYASLMSNFFCGPFREKGIDVVPLSKPNPWVSEPSIIPGGMCVDKVEMLAHKLRKFILNSLPFGSHIAYLFIVQAKARGSYIA